MREFNVAFSSFDDIIDFVSIATVQPFRVIAGNDTKWVNAKSLMGIAALDHDMPMRVRMNCTAEQFAAFQDASKKYLAR